VLAVPSSSSVYLANAPDVDINLGAYLCGERRLGPNRSLLTSFVI
jgi:hypothetical protein